MNKEQKKQAKEFLDKKLGGIKCLACGSKKCSFLNGFLSNPGGICADTPVYEWSIGSPTVGIMCDRCGYLMQFSSVISD